MWKNTVEPDRPRMTIGRMCIAGWITKSANTHSEYAILIAFPLQQWLKKRSLVLRYSTLAVLYFYVCTVYLVYSFYFNQQCTLYIHIYIYIYIYIYICVCVCVCVCIVEIKLKFCWLSCSLRIDPPYCYLIKSTNYGTLVQSFLLLPVFCVY